MLYSNIMWKIYVTEKFIFKHDKKHLQVRWSASDLSKILACPYKYKREVIEAVRGDEIVNADRQFGKMYHRGLEIFDEAIAMGVPREEALEKAVWFAERNLDKLNVFEDTKKTGENLIRSLVWYEEKWRGDGYKTLMLDGKPAIEFAFEVPIPNTAYTMTGFIDKLAISEDGLAIIERKTTGNTIDEKYFNQFDYPNIQSIIYRWAVRDVLKFPVKEQIIDATQIAVGFTRFVRSPIILTDEHVDEFFTDLKYTLEEAFYYAENNYYPRRASACFLCDHKSHCSQSPNIRGKA